MSRVPIAGVAATKLILDHIRAQPPLSHKHLAFDMKKNHGISESTTRGAVSKLIKDGLIERVPATYRLKVRP